jgi:hypothetical protein
VCGGSKCGAGLNSSLTGNHDFGIDTYLSSGMIHHHSTHPDAAAILVSSKRNLYYFRKVIKIINQFVYIVVFIRSVFISFITFLTPL